MLPESHVTGLVGRPTHLEIEGYRPGMGKVRPAGRMRPSDSFCAARRQQQKRFNVRPFKKSWDTWIFQISFVWLRVLTSEISHRWMLLRINCESTYSRPLDVSATNKYQQLGLLSAFRQHSIHCRLNLKTVHLCTELILIIGPTK